MPDVLRPIEQLAPHPGIAKAREEGLAARQAGKSPDANPYLPNDPDSQWPKENVAGELREAWQFGYNSGSDQQPPPQKADWKG